MAGRTFYKAADGSLTPAGKARAYNAELRRKGKEGMLYTGQSNFGTAGKDTGEIAYGEAEDYVKNGDIIAVENEDGTISRTKVNDENREELLGTRRGTMKPNVQQFSDYGPYQEGQKLKGGTNRRYNDDEVSTGGARKGGRRIVIPASFNEPSKGGAKGARTANRNKQKILQGKPLVSKKQKANAARRAASKIKTASTNKKLKKSRDKARAATRATNARLRQRKADGIKKRREKRELKKYNKEQRKDAQRARKKATAGAKPKTRRTSTDATATKVKKKVEKKAPKNKPKKSFESESARIFREREAYESMSPEERKKFRDAGG